MSDWYTRKKQIISRYIQKFGVLTGLRLLRKLYFHPMLKHEKIDVIYLPDYSQPIYVRLGTSDVYIFTQIFVNEEYDLSFLNLNPKIIVDGGAYVGFSSLFFAHVYPQARIFAIEPEESNFGMLVQNTRFYPNIMPVHAALWNKQSVLQIIDSKLGKPAFQVTETKEEEFSRTVHGLPIDKLLINADLSRIDILKLDIEGSEKELFESNYENWLNKVNVIVIELHDRFRKGCSESFYNAINPYNFRKNIRGDHVILFKDG